MGHALPANILAASGALVILLVEVGSTVKHVPHISDFTNIPAFNKLIKALLKVEQSYHVCDIADIPAVHDTIGAAIARIAVDSSREIGLSSKLKPTTVCAGVGYKITCTSSLQVATVGTGELLFH